MAQVTKQVNKWKDKHKLLSQHKKEEDLNFKTKFDLLISVEESRSKIKGDINLLRNGKDDGSGALL